MGRPLNKNMFGETAGDNDKVAIQFWNGSTVVTGWVTEQVATGEYLVSNGTVTDRVELQAATVTATGQGRVVVTVYGGSTEYASNILARRVKTFAGGNYEWAIASATKAGQADIALG